MARLLSGALLLCCVATAAADEDPYLWLEDVEGEKALAWVEEQNKTSLGYLEALPTFATFRDRNLEIYDSDERIQSEHENVEAVDLTRRHQAKHHGAVFN